jgi:protein TonB
MPKPNYPLQAFQEGIEGTVLVEILIDAEGRVARSRVVESVPGLDEAALAAVREWRFIPARKEGKAVPALAHVPVSFKIGADKK